MPYVPSLGGESWRLHLVSSGRLHTHFFPWQTVLYVLLSKYIKSCGYDYMTSPVGPPHGIFEPGGGLRA